MAVLRGLWLASVPCWGCKEMPTKQNAPQNPKAVESAVHKRKFTGTDNPRHLRAIDALMTRPTPREQLDKTAGCSNGPELVAELRRRGLSLPCKRIKFIDRDGLVCRPGVYFLTETDRKKIIRWISERDAAHSKRSMEPVFLFDGM